MNISIEKKIDELTTVEYRFTILDSTFYSSIILFLDGYYVWKKEAKRHKPRLDSYYNRLNDRDSTIKESEVILTDEIKKEAMNKVIASMKVLKWSEKNK